MAIPKRARSHLGHYSTPRVHTLPPVTYTIPPRSGVYPLPEPLRRATGVDPWKRAAELDTGELPSLARSAQSIHPHKHFSRHTLPSFHPPEVVPMPRNCPYRTSRPDGVTIEIGHSLSSADNAPAKRNARSHMVLYTHDSPFITARQQIVKKMTPADFEKMSERYGYSPVDMSKFHKFFSKLMVGKGLDEAGLAQFTAKFGNVDPTDDFVCQRLFEITNKRNNPTISFDQTMGLLQILQPPQNVFDPESMHLQEAPNTIAKAHLFFDICDSNESGSLCLREIEDMCRVKNIDRLDVAKERRKMMMENVMDTVMEKLGKNKQDAHSAITRDELIHILGCCDTVHAFFRKGLFLAAALT